MRPSVQDLSLFYASPLGGYVAAEINTLLKTWAPSSVFAHAIGLGYASPYKEVLCALSQKTLLIMPASQGAEPGTCLAREEMLPLADDSCDAMLLVHCLEFALDSSEVLKESWRVLTPGGSLFIFVPNIYGLWAHFSVTPFGMGKAFSEADLRTIFEDVGFRPGHSTFLLSVPWLPAESFLRKHLSTKVLMPEKVLPGVLAMQGVKTLYRPVLLHDVEDPRECPAVSFA
ncbi:MAG: class I SAM-dependent methyltransferase [Holosporales bacterium]|nr:class I SAM-dependent methyltransferase [Holosporales bacterium]